MKGIFTILFLNLFCLMIFHIDPFTKKEDMLKWKHFDFYLNK